MSFTVFLGNLPTWVTADDIKQWLAAEDLVADSVKVIRNHETQESKGFAFVEAPTSDEMQSIIRRFDRALSKTRFFAPTPLSLPKAPSGVRWEPHPMEVRMEVRNRIHASTEPIAAAEKSGIRNPRALSRPNSPRFSKAL